MKRTTLALLATLGAGLALPAFAQNAGGPTTELAQVEGGHFAVDKTHAKIIFSTTHFGFSRYYGLFTDFDAKLDFDPKAPAKSALDVTVNTTGIDTTNPKLDEHLKSADFFDVAKFPTATFKATKISVTGKTTGTITGDLTLHGVTKPVTLDVVLNKIGANPLSNAQSAGFGATTTIKRSDFGITTFSPNIGEDVVIEIQLEGLRS